MTIKTMYQTVEQTLGGWPDTLLSFCLVISGITIILVGLFAPRVVKLIVLAWIWFP